MRYDDELLVIVGGGSARRARFQRANLGKAFWCRLVGDRSGFQPLISFAFEGITWARGWSKKRAAALEAAYALHDSAVTSIPAVIPGSAEIAEVMTHRFPVGGRAW